MPKLYNIAKLSIYQTIMQKTQEKLDSLMIIALINFRPYGIFCS